MNSQEIETVAAKTESGRLILNTIRNDPKKAFSFEIGPGHDNRIEHVNPWRAWTPYSV